jgi:hypothetical protein
VPVTIAAASGRLIAFRDLHSERRIFPELEWRVANPQHKRRTNRPDRATIYPDVAPHDQPFNLFARELSSRSVRGITRVVSLP